MMRLLYFAWIRQRIGHAEEELAPPANVATVGALLDWLDARGGGYAKALENRKLVRVAVNQAYAQPGDPVRPGDEIALFPPVTGG
jgi:molybdopterin synthase sulfur carrier subunit